MALGGGGPVLLAESSAPGWRAPDVAGSGHGIHRVCASGSALLGGEVQAPDRCPGYGFQGSRRQASPLPREARSLGMTLRSWSPTTRRWSGSGSAGSSPPPGFTVVGEAANGAEAVDRPPERTARRAADGRADAGLDGIEATRQIISDAELSGVRVIILTTFDLDDYVFGALRAGASGFLLKDTLPRDLLTAIRVVAAGEALLAPSVTRRLISEFARIPPLGAPGYTTGSPGPGSRPPPGTAHRPGRCPPAGRQRAGRLRRATPGQATAARAGRVTGLLTERECEVLRLVAAGMSNGEIADHLSISPATAKTHVAHLLTKLDARDRVQLVIIAYQAGLAPPAPLARGPAWIPGAAGGNALVPGSLVRESGTARSFDVCGSVRVEPGGSPPLVAEVAPVVLEDEADRRA